MDRKPRYTQAVLVSREASDGIDGGPPAFTFRVTSETTDRWGESIATDGWRIDHYQSNPVVLDSHQYEGIKNIVGRVTDLRFEWDDGTAQRMGRRPQQQISRRDGLWQILHSTTANEAN